MPDGRRNEQCECMNGMNTKLRTYLSHPNHLLSTTDVLPTSRTHRVIVDNSSHDLGESVATGGPTRPHGCIEAESGKSNTLYMDYRWCRSDPEARYAKTKPLQPIEEGQRAVGQHNH